jgi:hypothetical protein
MIHRTGKLTDWTAVEAKRCREGVLPDAQAGANEELYVAHLKEFNARKAEAVVLERAADPLLAARALAFRGKLEQSRGILESLSAGTSLRDGTRMEVLLEQSRLAAFEGRWADSLASADLAIALRPAPVTLLTLLQVRALASFETGAFAPALEDLASVESLAEAFPASISVFYAQVLRIRIEYRNRGPQAAFEVLRTAWLRLASDPEASLDRVQALARVEVELRRLAGLDHSRWAYASYAFASHMGEDLYAGLAAVDCAYSLPASDREPWLRILPELEKRFRRIQAILAELRGERAPTSQTLACFVEQAPRFEDRPSAGVPSPTAPLDPTWVFLEYGLTVSLQPFSIHLVETRQQIHRALAACAAGPVSREGFFHATWGNTRYRPDLHDNLISVLLMRIRKTLGLPLRGRSGRIVSEGIAFVP